MSTQTLSRMPVVHPARPSHPELVERPALSSPKGRPRAATSPGDTASSLGMTPSRTPPRIPSKTGVPSCLGASHPRPKNAPPQPKSFLEKTLIRANPPHFAVVPTPEIGTPYHDAVRDTVAYKPTPDSL